MLFTSDIILIGEAREVHNNKLEQWRHILESREFGLNKSVIPLPAGLEVLVTSYILEWKSFAKQLTISQAESLTLGPCNK